MNWQERLYSTQQNLVALPCARKVVEASAKFLRGRESGHLINHAYPELLHEVAGWLVEAAGPHGDLKGSDLVALEKKYRAYLVAVAK